MVYLEINKKNYETGSPTLIDQLNKHLTRNNDKIFILFYMEGCGPCNATRPEWSKLNNVLSHYFINRKDIAVISIDQELSGKLKNIGSTPNSFPTMRFITHNGKINENYEDSNITTKDRTIDSFIEWIKLKTGEKNITKSENNKTRKHFHKKQKTRKQRGGKWSAKYKRSINCSRPKGFSQKQYCKYGRK
jgi:thiol-disulfide isomerase/thioredoxin